MLFTNKVKILVAVLKQNVTISFFLHASISEHPPIISPRHVRHHSVRGKNKEVFSLQVAGNHPCAEVIEVSNPAMKENESLARRRELAVRQVMKRTVHGRVRLQGSNFPDGE